MHLWIMTFSTSTGIYTTKSSILRDRLQVFWKTVKPHKSANAKSSEKITLVHGNKIKTTDDENVVNVVFFF